MTLDIFSHFYPNLVLAQFKHFLKYHYINLPLYLSHDFPLIRIYSLMKNEHCS